MYILGFAQEPSDNNVQNFGQEMTNIVRFKFWISATTRSVYNNYHLAKNYN